MAAAVHESPASALTQIRDDPALGPGLVLVGVLAVYAVKSGATGPTVWYPGALLLLGLGATVLYGRIKAGLPFARSLTAAAGLFAAYVAVAYASITWSHAKGLAWDGANLSLLYLIVFVTSAALPWRRATAAALLAAYGLFAAGVGVVELVRAAGAHDPAAGTVRLAVRVPECGLRVVPDGRVADAAGRIPPRSAGPGSGFLDRRALRAA
jgi:hypothetical protein